MDNSNNNNAKNVLFSFRWEQFRCFRDTGLIKIKPLTIFIGPNNSGKTSLIHPLLVLKQTIESKDIELPLKTKGKFVHIGGYKSFINNHKANKTLKFEIVYHSHEKSDTKIKEIGTYPPSNTILSFKKVKEKNEIHLKSFQVYDTLNRRLLKRDLKKKGDYDIWCFKEFKGGEKETLKIIRETKPRHFLFDAEEVIRLMLIKPEPSTGEVDFKEAQNRLKGLVKKAARPDATIYYISTIIVVKMQINDILSKIDYIGPLRQQPKRYYESIGEKPYSVGPKGEYTPELLLRMKNDRNFTTLNIWMKKFGLEGEIACPEHNAGLFSIIIRDINGQETNIADLGFGISQILPLITQGIWMKKGRILIAEQPEIHLNPKLQTQLADFLAHIVNSGKNVILETHSEHLLLRLRTLIADPNNKLKSNDVALYFVEKGSKGSSVREIPIKDNGHIDAETWPKGFFEDSLIESFNLAYMQDKGKGINEPKSD